MNRTVFNQVTDVDRIVTEYRIHRSQRLPEFFGLSRDVNKVLNKLSIGVIGAGSVGRNFAEMMARMNIGSLFIVDRGKFKAESVLTHRVTPQEACKGTPKARSTASLCRRISPTTECFYYDGPVENLEMSALVDVDVVVLCTDNLAAEKEVSERCIHLQLPLLQCAVHGETLVAQVRFCSNQKTDSPCFCCSYGEQEREQLAAGTYYSCLGPDFTDPEMKVKTVPTMSTAFLCSLAADLGATAILRYLLALGRPIEDCQIEYCGYNNSASTTPLHRSKDCLCDHTQWKIKRQALPLTQMSLRDLIVIAEYSNEGYPAGKVSITVGDLFFVELGVCGSGHKQSIRRFTRKGHSVGRCRRCGRPVQAHPFYTHRRFPTEMACDLLDRSLSQLGVKRADSVLVRSNDTAVLILENLNTDGGGNQE